MPTEGNFNVGTGLVDPATIAWVDAVVANGGTVSPTQQSLTDGLIRGLKADNNLFARLDRIWLYRAENPACTLVDIIHGQLATLVGPPTFSAHNGYTGGSPSYIDSNVNPSSTPGLNYVEASACAFAVATGTGQDTGAIFGRAPGGTSSTNCYPRYIDDTCYWRVNGAGGDQTTPSLDGSGMWCVTNLDGTTESIYRNGVLFDQKPFISNVILDVNLLFLLSNVDYYSGEIALGGLGAGLTDEDALNLYNRSTTYLVSA